MAPIWRGQTGTVIVAGLLLLQVGVLFLSVTTYEQISIFCTGPATSNLSWIFGCVHLLLLGLVIIGIVSLTVVKLRVPYIALLAAAVALLPVQATLVNRHVLSCDGP